MTKAEILKQAAGIVAALIKSKTPDLADLEKAYKDFGTVLKGLSPGDAVTTEVACDINSVMERMEAFCSGYCSNDPSQLKKAYTLPEFAIFLKAEVDGALADPSLAKTLKRLHVLAGQIDSAGAEGAGLPSLNKAESFEDTTTITIPVSVDPAQIIPTASTSSAAAAQSGTPAGDSAQFSNQGGNPGPVAGNATSGNIATQGTGNPADGGNYQAAKAVPVAPETTIAAVVATVEKATGEPSFGGWPMDINAPKRKSEVHFGKDPLRPRA